EFPLGVRAQAQYGGNGDAFVTKLAASGNRLEYSTYLGGHSEEGGAAIALDHTGSAYVTGYTLSSDFPTLAPLQGALAGASDGFVSKLGPAGNALVYSTYLGGRLGDSGAGIAVDSSGSAYVTGSTQSSDFPTANPLQASFGGYSDAFVAQLSATGAALVYSTYLGGSFADYGNGIAVDSSGAAYVTGEVYSADFPTVDPAQAAYGGRGDAFVTKFRPGGASLEFSTYLGGSGGDYGQGIAVDPNGSVYVTGFTYSVDFPVKNPFQALYRGSNDAFVAKLGEPQPVLDITMSQADYTSGDTVAAREFRVRNPTSRAVKIRLRVWLKDPMAREIDLIETGSGGALWLPAALDVDLWQFDSRVREPRTGLLLSEDRNPFVVR
ncbi:MAG: hypothetical protein DMG07_06410, partial [Acidobacteria bacterium]